MIHFFGNADSKVFAVQTTKEFTSETISKLTWLFGDQNKINSASLDAFFIGPRAAMITPWSTNAVEITQNMGISNIIRIEEFTASSEDFSDFDPMISEKYNALDQEIFTIDIQPESILNIDDINSNEKIKSNKSYFFESFFLAVTNPKPILFFTAIFPQFLDLSVSILPQFLIMTFAFLFISFFSLCSYAYLAKRSKSYLSDKNRMNWFHKITGGIFISMGIGLLSLKNHN